MDKSEQFIKMCDCPEIQQYATWTGGKTLDRGYTPDQRPMCVDTDGKTWIKGYGMFLWLPTQSDLQGMVWNSGSALHPIDMFRCFMGYMHKRQDYFYLDGLSPEKCWLMYVMAKKYNKVWDGEKWEAE